MTRLKIPILASAVLLMVAILPAIMAADYSDWVAKGYRWSLVSAGQVGVPAEEFSRHSGKIREVQDRASQARMVQNYHV
jgi:hypothetical protein